MDPCLQIILKCLKDRIKHYQVPGFNKHPSFTEEFHTILFPMTNKVRPVYLTTCSAKSSMTKENLMLLSFYKGVSNKSFSILPNVSQQICKCNWNVKRTDSRSDKLLVRHKYTLRFNIQVLYFESQYCLIESSWHLSTSEKCIFPSFYELRKASLFHYNSYYSV